MPAPSGPPSSHPSFTGYTSPANPMSRAHVDMKSAAVHGAIARGHGGSLKQGQLDPHKYHKLDAKRTQIPAYSQIGEPSKDELAKRMTVVNVEEVAEDIVDEDGNVIDTIYHQSIQVFKPDDPENPWNHSQGKAVMTQQPPQEQPEGMERLRQLENQLTASPATAPQAPPSVPQVPPMPQPTMRIQVTRGDQPTPMSESTPPPATAPSPPETPPTPVSPPSTAPDPGSQTLLLELVQQLMTLTSEVASIKKASLPIQPATPPKSVTSPTPSPTMSEPAEIAGSETPNPARASVSEPETSSTSPSSSPPSGPSTGRPSGLPVPKLRLVWDTPMGQTQCPAEQVVLQRQGDGILVVVVYDVMQDTSFIPAGGDDQLTLTVDSGEQQETMVVQAFGLNLRIPLDPTNPEGRVWKLVLLKRVE